MDFEEQLKRAIERGRSRGDAHAAAHRQSQLSDSDRRGRHNQIRLRVSDHIEGSMHKLADHFPGFQTEILYGDKGWGAAVGRDDAVGKRQSQFSRLEVFVRPYSSLGIVDLIGKGTIRNRELFQRNFYEDIEQADPQRLEQLVDSWLLEYAELYAAQPT
jgi:hypothetical protein